MKDIKRRITDVALVVLSLALLHVAFTSEIQMVVSAAYITAVLALSWEITYHLREWLGRPENAGLLERLTPKDGE